MRHGKSSQEANRLKKQQRMESKKDLQKHYIKVVREPTEKGLKAYTKIVNARTADKLINGKPVIMNNMIVGREKLSRTFKQAS